MTTPTPPFSSNPSGPGSNPEIQPESLTNQLQITANAFATITRELDLNTVLQLIADSARQVANSNFAALGIVDEEGVITEFITSGISQEEREKIGELPRGHGLLGILIKQGRPLRVRDMTKDPRRSGFPPNHPPMTSLLGVPVSIQGNIVGDLYLTDKIGKDEFDEEDEWWLTLFSRQAAIAIMNARLYEDTRSARLQAEALADLTGSLNRYTQPLELFEQISKATCRLLNLPSAAVFLLDEKVGRFSLQTGVGLTQTVTEGAFLPLKGSLAGEMLVGGKTVTVYDTGNLTRVYMPPLASGQLPKSVVVVPIKQAGKIKGVSEAYSDRFRHFNPGEIALLEAFAANASLALEKAHLFEQKEQFFSMTAHDLRTPLTAIKMSSGLVSANLPENFPPLLTQLIENIARNSQRLDNLIEDLLDLNRLENGSVQLKPVQLEAGESITAVVDTLKPLFAEKSQTLTLSLPTEKHRLWADRRRLEQILVNLLSNANKYTPEKGKVEVILGEGPNEEGILIRVKDSGPGIPLEEQDMIFDRYYRRPIHEQGTKTSGTGLGLPITRNLVELHGGKIWVESLPGQGTTFFVRLPTGSATPTTSL